MPDLQVGVSKSAQQSASQRAMKNVRAWPLWNVVKFMLDACGGQVNIVDTGSFQAFLIY